MPHADLIQERPWLCSKRPEMKGAPCQHFAPRGEIMRRGSYVCSHLDRFTPGCSGCYAVKRSIEEDIEIGRHVTEIVWGIRPEGE